MTIYELEDRFAELCISVDATAWWETESYWEEWEDLLIEEGYDPEEVEDFFSQMAWDM